jgi:hypothetical protein
VNARDPEGRARWEAAGRPILPSLEVDGVASPIMHPSQIASLLGLDGEEGDATAALRLAWDLSTVLDAWVDHLRLLDWETICAPTPSRSRSLRNLTCNTFHPIELIPGAVEHGSFPWDPDGDEEREAALHGAQDAVDYASGIAMAFQGWLLGAEELLQEAGARPVRTLRGDVDVVTLLVAQRWHASFHYRQLKVFLASRGITVPGSFTIEALADLDLPEEVF